LPQNKVDFNLKVKFHNLYSWQNSSRSSATIHAAIVSGYAGSIHNIINRLLVKFNLYNPMKSRLKRLLLIGFIISNSLLLAAQDNPDSRNIRIKLYVNAFYKDIENHDYHGFLEENETYKFKNKKYDIGAISFAAEFGSHKKIKHEVELMPLKFDQNDILEIHATIEDTVTIMSLDWEWTKSLRTACRYQLNYYFIQNKYIMPFIGLSSQFFYEYVQNGYFPYYDKDQFWGLIFAFTPGIIFNINEKISIDLNVPVDLYYIEINYEEKEDYSLRSKTSKIINEFTPETINLRLGICYKL